LLNNNLNGKLESIKELFMKAFFVFILFFCASFIVAQNDDSPSVLLKKLSNAKEDKVITDLYNQLGQYYYEVKYDSAYYYFNKGLSIARKKNIQSEIAYLLTSKARVIIYEGNYNDAIDTLKKAMVIFKQNNLARAIATVNTSIGVVFYNKSQYDSCKYYWNKSLNIYKSLNDSSGLATIYSNMGVVNYVQGNAEVALDNYLKSLEIRKKIKSTNALASLYMKIALIYQNFFQDNLKSYQYVSEAVQIYRNENNKLGETKALINKANTLDHLDSTQRAFEIYLQALESAEEIGNKRLLATLYSVLGDKYTIRRQYKLALDYLYKSLNYNEEMGQIRELAKNYNRIGVIFHELADYNTALSYYQKSLELADKLNLHDEKQALYYSMSQVTAKMNNYKKAYEYYQNYVTEKDSMSRRENKQILAEMEAKYTNQQNQQKIEYLEKEKENKDEQLRKSIIIRNLLIGMALLVLAVALLFFKRFRDKTQINNELRQRNQQFASANEKIQQNVSNIQEFNKLLMEKNEVIQKQNADITESNRTKDRIFSIIGHDLRSPMSSIQTSLLLLQTKDFSAEKIAHIYQLMNSDLKSSLDLLENLLVWAKNQEGKMKLIKEEHSFNAVADKIVKSLDSVAQNKNIEIDYIPTENDTAYFDKSMISSVLRNLLVNALKFTKQGGTIRVKATLQDDILKVAVEDNGIGMDQTIIDKIKQKGNYYTQPGTNKERGSGLGLSICFDIIEMHNGTLEIESQLDKGSVFTFSIPIKPKE